MNKTPVLSVILPVYNAELYLKEAIDSVLSQTFQNFELIIINDGSTDSSHELLVEYDVIDPRIVLVRQENRGLVGALNRGIALAKGEYIARMDADDVCLPERFSTQLSYMELNNIDICGCHYFSIDESSQYIGAHLVPINQCDFIYRLFKTVPFAHGSVIFKKSLVVEHSLLYREGSKAEDLDMWMKMFRLGANFGNAPEFLFKYRELDTSLSKNFKNRQDAKRLSSHFYKLHSANMWQGIKSFHTKGMRSLTISEMEYIAYFLLKRFYSSPLLAIKVLLSLNKKAVCKAFVQAVLF